ncbi:MAG: hypothetical protein BWY88_01105 [Synergistetes bacterium ADurb.Bin520]|nr:MAG: hypothetical protein BWY88_01105 [Synergistetes bacterium ADurb.Bin520]
MIGQTAQDLSGEIDVVPPQMGEGYPHAGLGVHHAREGEGEGHQALVRRQGVLDASHFPGEGVKELPRVGRGGKLRPNLIAVVQVAPGQGGPFHSHLHRHRHSSGPAEGQAHRPSPRSGGFFLPRLFHQPLIQKEGYGLGHRARIEPRGEGEFPPTDAGVVPDHVEQRQPIVVPHAFGVEGSQRSSPPFGFDCLFQQIYLGVFAPRCQEG